MTIFSLIMLMTLSIIFSLPMWSFLFCLILAGPKVSNTFVLFSLVFNIFFNILDFIDIEIEFYFFIFLFIYISAIVVLFLFAYLILPINTEHTFQLKNTQQNKSWLESYELLFICVFWGILESIDQLVESYLDLVLEMTTIKYEHLNNVTGIAELSWITVAQVEQNTTVNAYFLYSHVHALSWFFLEKHFFSLIAVVVVLLTTIFGTIHWLRKSDVLEY